MNKYSSAVSAKMKETESNIVQRTIWMLCFVLGAFVFSFSSDANAEDHAKAESECFSYVQDKVKWDYDHTSRWEPHNIKQLCSGTTSPKQPGDCFHEVMHGGDYGNDGINWGSGTRWNWKNASTLCSGANDGKKRIACFSGRVKEGHKWQAAIAECLAIDR